MAVTAESLSNTERVQSWLWTRQLVAWSALLGGLFLLLYAPVIKDFIGQWSTDGDYSHGFFVPLFSAYVLWRERTRWTRTSIKPSNFGLVVLLAAVGLLLLGTLGAEFFTSRFSLLLLLTG